MSSDQRLRESLSAVWDSEANELELHRVLAEVHQDSELRDLAHRYRLLGAVLKQEKLSPSSIDLSASIRDAIAEEAPHGGRESSRRYGRWASRAGRVAIAASVTVAVLFGVQTYNYSLNSGSVMESGLAQAPQVIQQPGVIQAIDRMGASTLEAGYGESAASLSAERVEQARQYAEAISQQRLRTYMLQHAENSALGQYQGMLPFARLVNAESR
ncbi:sigma-E factor negative regulatory protein [Aestuariirhabdus litorea]|uniref:RNA polymerase subunit sigma n=1 Tax=Aestuariirhabdus litorea TaxID=2528527 RepID=A0A3P3VUP4_9GAMM|nr:RseA family anti-sigma factor [Aestuariirhabdus litorea]RRJ85159.1 RNA polymerase subunit sigma [Aestuariirhabdus litorea]RWW98381.1 RNA polymerase subunit sigma [Endozoicomonadaceae bacterium GTF-13]